MNKSSARALLSCCPPSARPLPFPGAATGGPAPASGPLVARRGSGRHSAPAVLLLAIGLALPGGPGHAGTAACDLTVGPDMSCDHATVAAAVGAAAFTTASETICVAQNYAQPNTFLTLSNFDNPTVSTGSGSLVIDGGFASCGSSSPNEFKATLEGGAANPVIEVDATTGRTSNVTLLRLRLTGGAAGLLAGSGARVQVVGSFLNENGRGIDMGAGSEVTVDVDSQIFDNDGADEGAGIRCVGADLDLAGQVFRNDGGADSIGGGVRAENCIVQLDDGAWIFENSAQNGGGLYLTQTEVRGGGTGTSSVRIFDNVADRGGFGSGGGMYVDGRSDVLLGNVHVVDNRALVRGAGITIVDAKVQLERFNFVPCANPPRCAEVSGNEGPVQSVAVSVTSLSFPAEFRMYQGFIENNLGTGAAWLIRTDGANASAYLEGVQISGNRVRYPLYANDSSDIVAAFVTVADNWWRNSLDVDLDAVGATTQDQGQVLIRSSIWADHVAFEGGVHADCLLAETNAGLISPTRSVFGSVDPGFIDPSNGNLRLRADSPAIDFCDTSVLDPLDSDYQLDPRGLDLATVPDVYGPFDLGADEATTGPPVILDIFADDFETGSTAAWTSTLP